MKQQDGLRVSQIVDRVQVLGISAIKLYIQNFSNIIFLGALQTAKKIVEL